MSHSWAIGQGCHDYIRTVADPGDTILELGSGDGTGLLIADGYRMVSIEHDARWAESYGYGNGNVCIHAPIVNGWYSPEVLRLHLPDDYDVLLIDGPPSYIGRAGILRHMDLFARWDVPVIVDDAQRPMERHLLYELAQRTGRQAMTVPDGNREFGVLL